MSQTDEQSISNLTVKQIKNGEIRYNQFGDYDGFYVDNRCVNKIEMIALLEEIEESIVCTTIKLHDLTTKVGDYVIGKIFTNEISDLRCVFVLYIIFFLYCI